MSTRWILTWEAAEAVWPNFVVFYERFKEHPSFGPGSVEDSVASSSSVPEMEIDLEPSSTGNTPTPASEITVCDISTSEEEEDGDGVEILQPPQSQQKQSVKKGGSTGEEMDEEEIMAPPLKKKKGTDILTARKAKKKSILYKQAVSSNIC